MGSRSPELASSPIATNAEISPAAALLARGSRRVVRPRKDVAIVRTPPRDVPCLAVVSLWKKRFHSETHYGITETIPPTTTTELLSVRAARHRQVDLAPTGHAGRLVSRPSTTGRRPRARGKAGAATRHGPWRARAINRCHRRSATSARSPQRRPPPDGIERQAALCAHRLQRTKTAAGWYGSAGRPRRCSHPASLHGTGTRP